MVTGQALKRQVCLDLPCIASERNGLRAQMGRVVRWIDEASRNSEPSNLYATLLE